MTKRLPPYLLIRTSVRAMAGSCCPQLRPLPTTSPSCFPLCPAPGGGLAPGHWGYLSDTAVLDKMMALHKHRLQQLALDLDNTLAEALDPSTLRAAIDAARSVCGPCYQQGSCSLLSPGPPVAQSTLNSAPIHPDLLPLGWLPATPQRRP